MEKILRSTQIRSQMIQKEKVMREMMPIQGDEMKKLFKQLESEVSQLNTAYLRALKAERQDMNPALI